MTVYFESLENNRSVAHHVWDEPGAAHGIAGSMAAIVKAIINGLTEQQAQQLLEIRRMKAADPLVPYVHVRGEDGAPDTIAAGDLVVEVVENPPGTFTATRQP